MEARRTRIASASIFAASFLSYFLVFDRNFDTPDQIADWLDNNLGLQYAGSIAIAIAGIAFLVLMSGLAVVVAKSTPAGERLGMPALVFAGGALFVGLLWVATPIDVGIAETVGSAIGVTSYDALSNIAFQHLLYSQMAVALSLSVLFVVGRRREWAPWLVWLTGLVVVTSVMQLILPALVLLLPVWAVAVAFGVKDEPAS